MSDFLSGLFGYSVLSLAGAAALLGNWSGPQPDQAPLVEASQYNLAASTQTASYDLGVEQIRFANQTEAPTIIIEAAALVDAPDLLAGLPQRAEQIIPAEEPDKAMARVTGTAVNLREGPSTSFGKISVVRLDDMLELTGATDGDWVEIIQAGTAGWMHGRYLEAVDTQIVAAQN